MNTPSPLIPQGALPTTRNRSHIRIAVFTILAVHLVLLFALLMAGCKKTSEQAKNDVPADTGAPVPPPFDPNVPPAGSNPPSVTPTSTVPPVITSTSATSSPVAPPPIDNKPARVETPPSSLAEGTEHTIMKGDSFYTLAKKYNVTQRAIANANQGVDPSRLKIGQKIKIPAAGPTTAATPAGNSATPAGGGGGNLYTVKSGDSLNKIAKNTGVSVKALRAENNLKTDQIKVGQKLKIPAKGATPTEVTGSAPAGASGTNL